MFGKVFASMYDGTLATRGPWQALVTFQQFIVLADRTGIVDMTADAIARRTTIPIDIIKIGIAALEQIDSESRSPELDGRRIARLSDNRDWGWQIVNYEKYRKIRSEDERRDYMAKLMRERRAEAKAADSLCYQPLAKLAHADVDVDVEAIKTKKKPKNPPKNGFELPEWIPAEHWNAWIEARTKKRNAPTDYAKRLAVSKLTHLRDQGHPPGQVLMQSAFNGWAGLFPQKEIK